MTQSFKNLHKENRGRIIVIHTIALNQAQGFTFKIF